jgi:hypothetical protein
MMWGIYYNDVKERSILSHKIILLYDWAIIMDYGIRKKGDNGTGSNY